jgi:predicted Zn-ribbon and HTH transcriptional regulator
LTILLLVRPGAAEDCQLRGFEAREEVLHHAPTCDSERIVR